MASLATTIQDNSKKLKRGPDGQLTEETGEETQSLASKAGLSAPPTTPAGVGMIGGNADQQKMAGTPAQMGKALSLATDPSQTLADARRRTQVRTEQTTAEQAEAQKSENLKSLGGLGDRVGDFINAQRAKLEDKSKTATGVDTQASTDYQNNTGQATDLAPIKDILAQLRADPNNMELQLQVNKYLGRNINSVIAPEEIDSLYEGATAAVSRAGAQTVDDSLTGEDLFAMPSFGYTPDQLSNLLGIPADQLNGMNVGQLREAINKTTEQEFNKTTDLQKQAVNPNAGAAERNLAQQAGQEASQTGLRTAEQNAKDINQQIANADTVLFGGKETKIDDLLKDENVSKIVEDYLNAPAGSSTRAQLERTEPGLTDFIKKNQSLFDEASKQLQGGAKGFGDIQTANKNVANFGDNGSLSDDVAKNLIPGFGELASKKITAEDAPVLGYLSGKEGPEQKTAVGNLNSFSSSFPEYTKELASLTPKQLDALGFHSGNFGQIIKPLQDKKLVQTTSNIDDIVRTMSGGALSANSTQLFKQANAVSVLGLGAKDPVFSKLDDNNDGVPDDIETLRSRALGPDPKNSTSLANLIGGSFNAVYSQKPNQQVPTSGVDGDIMNHLGGAAGDGRITADEIKNAYNDLTDKAQDPRAAQSLTNELLKISKTAKGMDQDARNSLNEQLTKARKLNTNNQLRDISSSTGKSGDAGQERQAQNNVVSLADKLNNEQFDNDNIRSMMASEAIKSMQSFGGQGQWGAISFDQARDILTDPAKQASWIDWASRHEDTTLLNMLNTLKKNRIFG